MNSFAVVVLVAGCGGDAPAPKPREPKADLSLSANRAKVGEPVELRITVEHPAGTDALFPPVGAELASGGGEAGGLEVVEAGKVKAEDLEPGVRVTSRRLTLRGFNTGGYTVGPFTIRLEPAERPTDDALRLGAVGGDTLAYSAEAASAAKAGQAEPSKAAPPPSQVRDGQPTVDARKVSPSAAPDRLTTPKARLEVYSVLAKESTIDDLRDEAGPFELPPEPARWGLWLALAVLAVAAAPAVAIGLVRLAARREELRRSPPPPPAHEVALAELRAVREAGLLEEGRVAEYADQVSDILRRYLEARFALPAPERTTEEFLDEVARAPVLDRQRKRFLADYLAQCDLVKFAAQDPGRRELEELFDSSVSFVRETADARGGSSAAEVRA